MKDFFKSCLAVGVAIIGFAAAAQTPVPPLLYPLSNSVTLNVANGATSVPTVSASNILSAPFPIWRDRGFVLHLASYGASGSATGTASGAVQFACPHTNYAGAVVTNWENPLLFSYTSTGTTEYFYSTNVPKVITDNYTIARLWWFTNASSVAVLLDPTNTFVSATP